MPKLMVHVLNSCDNVIARWVLLNFRQRTSLVCAKKFKQSTPVIMVMENLGLMETVTCWPTASHFKATKDSTSTSPPHCPKENG